jgi:hypothetical protein
MATKEEVKGLLHDLPFQIMGNCVFFMKAGKMIDLTHIQGIEYDSPDDDDFEEMYEGQSISISFDREEQSSIDVDYPLPKQPGKFDAEMRELFKIFATSRKYTTPKQKATA